MKNFTGKMVSIPTGSFLMGYRYVFNPANTKVNKYCPDEQPVHKVTLNAFQISSTVITQGQYKAITGENPSTFTGDDNLPVTNVSADNALKFCNMLSIAEGFEPIFDEKTGKCNFTKKRFPALNRSRVGICMPCRHNHTFLYR